MFLSPCRSDDSKISWDVPLSICWKDQALLFMVLSVDKTDCWKDEIGLCTYNESPFIHPRFWILVRITLVVVNLFGCFCCILWMEGSIFILKSWWPVMVGKIWGSWVRENYRKYISPFFSLLLNLLFSFIKLANQRASFKQRRCVYWNGSLGAWRERGVIYPWHIYFLNLFNRGILCCCFLLFWVLYAQYI